jgi:hypothetical protein
VWQEFESRKEKEEEEEEERVLLRIEKMVVVVAEVGGWLLSTTRPVVLKLWNFPKEQIVRSKQFQDEAEG